MLQSHLFQTEERTGMFSKLSFFLLAVCFVFAANSFGSYLPGASNQISLGGGETTSTLVLPESNPDGYFTLYASNAALAAINNVYPFYKNGALYQVTAGKTFKAVQICSWGLAITANPYQLMSATVTFAPDATAASLTGPVYQAGATARYPLLSGNLNGASQDWKCQSATYNFTTATWPGIQVGSPNTNYIGVMVTGKEI